MHLTETQINDFADGTLSASELVAAQQHVNTCAQCRGEVEALRSMLARVSALPRSIAPERNLRPHIWAKTEQRTLWQWRYPLAAAAIALIAISSIVTLLLTRGPNTSVTVRPDAQPAGVNFVAIEQKYTSELEQLQQVLRQNRDELAPETVQILEDNVRVIDSAINEARAALANDPGSVTLKEMLSSAYQRKVDLLKQAARTSAGT
jgi:anti-sigma factor RsiW